MRLSTLGLLVTLACGFGLWWPPRVTTAQQPGKLYRIGFLSVWSLPAPATPDEHQRPPFFQPFWEAMRQLGWREGQNIVMEERWADTQVERLPALATELVQMQVDLILAAATVETEAAKQATQTIPIVMVNSLDAVNTGLVASLSQPGANVTGMTALAWDTWAKRLKLLNETVPGSAPIAILWCTVGPTAGSHGQSSEQNWANMQFIAGTVGVPLQRLEVREPDDYERAFAAASRAGAKAMFVRPCYLEKQAGVNVQRLVDMAATHRLPTIYNSREFVQAGGLMSYGPSWPDGLRTAATYVDQILKGASPANLTVGQSTKFELVLNLKTAQALGLTLPPPILSQADDVIR